jgi:hypothetical protein
MILFYNKENDIVAAIDGRVHSENDLKTYISKSDDDIVGKIIIGWIKKNDKKIAYNLDKMDILKKFEDISSASPLDYKIENGKLIKNN